MDTKRKKLIVILGPTASGKTGLSIKLAKKFNGEIVSADSRQVYKYLDLGTGKVTKEEMDGIPHYMLDIVDPMEKYSSSQFQKKATEIIKNIKGLPFLVGGSAFYLLSIVDGWTMPEVKPDWELRKKLETKSAEELFNILKELDPERAGTVEKQNPRRLIRSIEIAKAIGKVEKVKNNPEFECLLLGIKREDPELKDLIKARLKQRIKDGMLDEVKILLDNKTLTYERCQELGLEYKWIAKFLNNEISQNEMEEKLATEIWRFSKHQMNWFKKRPVYWVTGVKEAEKLISNFIQ